MKKTSKRTIATTTATKALRRQAGAGLVFAAGLGASANGLSLNVETNANNIAAYGNSMLSERSVDPLQQAYATKLMLRRIQNGCI
jgi:hypothetical protein